MEWKEFIYRLNPEEFSHLKPRHRQAIVWKRAGRSFKEIAEFYDITPAGANTLFKQALYQLGWKRL